MIDRVALIPIRGWTNKFAECLFVETRLSSQIWSVRSISIKLTRTKLCPTQNGAESSFVNPVVNLHTAANTYGTNNASASSFSSSTQVLEPLAARTARTAAAMTTANAGAIRAAAVRACAVEERHGELALLPLTSAAVVFISSTQRVTRLDDNDGNPNRDGKCSVATSPPVAMTIAAVTSPLSARERAGQLPHVVSSVSAFLDFTPCWTIPSACEQGHLAMLPRLASRESADINKHYRPHLFSKGLVHAAQRGDLPMVQWLCCSYCPSAFVWRGMEAAADAGQLSVLQWLTLRYDYMQWDAKAMDRVAANGHLDVLQWIYEQPGHAECSSHAANSAVENDHLRVLTWLLERYPEYARKCGNGISVAICSGDIERVQRLIVLGLEFDFSSHDFVTSVVQSGCLEMVQLVHRFASERTSDDAADAVRERASWSLTEAAGGGQLEIVKWLREQHADAEVTHAVVCAAAGGHLHVVKWLHESGVNGFSASAMDEAAWGGHLEIVQWFHKHCTEGCTADAMDFAANSGHLDIVKWLHEHRTDGCTTAAMDGTARSGHLDVVQWLHDHRSEGCTTDAMDFAAFAGHFDVVQWLHDHRSEGCTTVAMNTAAENGHLEIVEYLHEHRTEGCTTVAMNTAAENGHLEIVKYLHEHRTEGCTTVAMDEAAFRGHLEIVQWLHEHRTEGCTTAAMDCAASKGHLEVMQRLHANRVVDCTAETARSAIQSEQYEVLQWLADACPHTMTPTRPFRTRGRTGMKVLLPRIQRHVKSKKGRT